jgi:hypothetical protein
VNAGTLPEMAKADPDRLLTIAEQGILNGKHNDWSMQVAFMAVTYAAQAKPELAARGIKAVKQGMAKAKRASFILGFSSFTAMAEANLKVAGESAAAIRECLPLAKDNEWSRLAAQEGLEEIGQIMKENKVTDRINAAMGPEFEELGQVFAAKLRASVNFFEKKKKDPDYLLKMAKADPDRLLTVAEQGISNSKHIAVLTDIAVEAVTNAVQVKPELGSRGIKAVEQCMAKAEDASNTRTAQKGLEKIGQIMKSEDKIQVAKTNRKMAQLEQGLYTGDFSHMDFADLENLSDVAKANPDKLFDAAKKAVVEAKNTGTMVVASDALASVVAVQPKRAKEALELLSQSLDSGKYGVLEVMHVASDCVDIANANPDVAKQAKEVKDKFDVAYVESKKRLKSNRSPEMIKKISEAKTQRH